MGLVESICMVGETVTTEHRYYVSSLPANPVVFGVSVRPRCGRRLLADFMVNLHYIKRCRRVLRTWLKKGVYRMGNIAARQNHRKYNLLPIAEILRAVRCPVYCFIAKEV
jgi:hypothetical protein